MFFFLRDITWWGGIRIISHLLHGRLLTNIRVVKPRESRKAVDADHRNSGSPTLNESDEFNLMRTGVLDTADLISWASGLTREGHEERQGQ
jgi:hypothetical protein